MPITGYVSGCLGLTVSGAGPQMAGDVVAGANFFIGLRPYTISAVGRRALNLRRDSDQATRDFVTVANGVDIPSIIQWQTAAGAANLWVTAWYDQTGNGLDMLQATTTLQPQFVLNSLGTFPTVVFTVAANTVMTTTGNLIQQANQTTVYAVANRSANVNQASLMLNLAGNTYQLGYRTTADNQAFLFNNQTVAATATDGAWHVLQAVFNGGASDMNVDGTSTLGNDAGNANGHGQLNLGAFGGTNQPIGASIMEIGNWPSVYSTTLRSAMSSNAHAFYRF